MTKKMFLTAERKAFAAFMIAAVAFAAALVLTGTPVLAQPQDAPGHPGLGADDSDGPPPALPHRKELREQFREQRMERRMQRQGAMGGPGMGGAGMGAGMGPGMGGPAGDGPGGMGVGRLGRALDLVQSFQTAVQDPHQAIGLAALGIKQHYHRIGKPLDAVKELDDMLKSTTDQKTRNIFLFTIRQVYEEQKQSDKFLEISRQIVKENLGK